MFNKMPLISCKCSLSLRRAIEITDGEQHAIAVLDRDYKIVMPAEAIDVAAGLCDLAL